MPDNVSSLPETGPPVSHVPTMSAVIPDAPVDVRLSRSVDGQQERDKISQAKDQVLYGILVVDDDLNIHEAIRAILAAPDRVIHCAKSAAEAEVILANEDISLVFLDLLLPDKDGRDMLVGIRKNVRTAGLPVFVLSALSSNKIKAECFARGADEFFEKSWDASILCAAVASKLDRNNRIVCDLRRDSLTGLANRAAFHEAFDKAASLSIRSGQPLSVGIIDLDHFKDVNDRHGHPAGDAVLTAAATLIEKTCRSSDFVARWGGEEFVVFLQNTDVADAHRALTKVLETLRATPLAISDDESLSITFSAGIALWTEGASAEEAISEADHFLYIAKAEGRNKIVSSNVVESMHRKKILIGDDDERVVPMIKHRLERAGFEVVQISNGYEILSAALDLSISMILLNVKMPGMDGFEILSRLCSYSRLRHVPIVIMTAAGSEPDIVRGIELGADDYLVKPFSFFELLARIHRLLRGKRYSSAQPAAAS